jgi:uncharacterized protein YjcR
MNSKYAVQRTPDYHRRTSKLTEDDIGPIRDRIANGEMLKDIAKDYGVSPTTIGSVKRGYTWSHVG